MLRLDSTLRKIEILLGGVVASSQLAFVASWSDATTTSYSGGATPGVTSDTTPVTVVEAPGAGIVRDVDYISVANRDTFAATVTLQYNDNGVSYPIVTIALEVGSQLVYTHGSGWNVVDSSGSFKTGVAGPSGSTGMVGPIGPAVYMTGEEGIDGLDGVPGRAGLNGANGLTGAVGPVGPALFMVSEDPEESLQGSPGSRGLQGETGAQGPVGPAIFLVAEDPEIGEFSAPGKAGLDGVTGVQGPVGPVVMWDYPDEADPILAIGESRGLRITVAFSAYQSSAQSISNTTPTKVLFQTKEFDTTSTFDNAVNSRFQPIVAGYYQINASVRFSANTSTPAAVVYKNGSAYKDGVLQGSGPTSTVSSIVYLNGTTDYVEIWGYQASGGALSTVALSNTTYMQGCLLSGV